MMHNDKLKDLAEFCSGVLTECVSQEKPEMLNTYMETWKLLQKCKESAAGPFEQHTLSLYSNRMSEVGNVTLLHLVLLTALPVEYTLLMTNLCAAVQYFKSHTMRMIDTEGDEAVLLSRL